MPAAAATYEGAYQSTVAKERKMLLDNSNVIGNDRVTNNYVSPM